MPYKRYGHTDFVCNLTQKGYDVRCWGMQLCLKEDAGFEVLGYSKLGQSFSCNEKIIGYNNCLDYLDTHIEEYNHGAKATTMLEHLGEYIENNLADSADKDKMVFIIQAITLNDGGTNLEVNMYIPND